MEKGSTRTALQPAARDREVASRFLELLGSMKRYVRERLPPLGEGGMSEERFRTLLTLRYYGKGYLKTLAAHDGLSSSALCIMLNRMVEEKLAARAEDPDDRRNVSYELTAAGGARLDAELERRADLVRGGLGRMGDAEKARFARAIETVLAGVEKLKSPKCNMTERENAGRHRGGNDESSPGSFPGGRLRAREPRDTGTPGK